MRWVLGGRGGSQHEGSVCVCLSVCVCVCVCLLSVCVHVACYLSLPFTPTHPLAHTCTHAHSNPCTHAHTYAPCTHYAHPCTLHTHSCTQHTHTHTHVPMHAHSCIQPSTPTNAHTPSCTYLVHPLACPHVPGGLAPGSPTCVPPRTRWPGTWFTHLHAPVYQVAWHLVHPLVCPRVPGGLVPGSARWCGLAVCGPHELPPPRDAVRHAVGTLHRQPLPLCSAQHGGLQGTLGA